MTKLDIYDSASAFARKTLDITGDFDLAQKSVEQFNSEKLGKEDFPYWNETFRQQRERMLALRNRPAESTKKAPAKK
jgi:hypothetical protein